MDIVHLMHPQHLIFGFELFGYTTQTELGERVLDCAASLPAAEGSITFDITNYPYNISTIEALKGKKGYLTLKKLTIQSYDTEEMLVLHGGLDDGSPLDTDIYGIIFCCFKNSSKILSKSSSDLMFLPSINLSKPFMILSLAIFQPPLSFVLL